MPKVNSFLAQRFKQATEKLSKMTNLVELSSQGKLSSFTGVFRVGQLTEKEQEALLVLLEAYKQEEQEIQIDLKALIDITAEVKAINNQAIILHGERIKKAQNILKNYKDGAFSAWLTETYGNRQTPYNFLQYYELYLSLPQDLHSKLDQMPKQAIYSLASRSAPLERKKEIIQNYKGEPKQELLNLIRNAFPLAENDKRAHDSAEMAILSLLRIQRLLLSSSYQTTDLQRKTLLKLLEEMKMLILSK